jgi:VanZ family protein
MKTVNQNTFLTITLPFILWTALMIAVSSTPGKKLPEVGLWNFDKFAHCVEFFVFSFLLFRYMHLGRHVSIMQTVRLGIIIGIAYAGLDELHQMAIPNRLCTWQDFIADTIGVLTGFYTAHWFYKRKRAA